jgi:hypothetical protein
VTGVVARASAHASVADWAAYVLGGVPGLILAGSAALGFLPNTLVIGLFALSFIGLNLVHLSSTWSRVYLDPAGWRSRRLERVTLPALLVLATLAIEAAGGALLLLSIQYYLSLHHGVMENYGIVRFTEKRLGRRRDRASCHLLIACCMAGPLAALLWRARHVATTYHGVSLLAVPEWFPIVLAGVAAVALPIWVLGEWRARLRGEPVSALGVALVLLTNLLWSGLLLNVEHPLLPLFAIASAHYVQHIYFVWRFEHRPQALAELPARWRGWIAPPKLWRYLLALAALGASLVLVLTGACAAARWAADTLGFGTESRLLPPWTAAMIAVNFWHYWLDHRVWRAPTTTSAAPDLLAIFAGRRREPLRLARERE